MNVLSVGWTSFWQKIQTAGRRLQTTTVRKNPQRPALKRIVACPQNITFLNIFQKKKQQCVRLTFNHRL